jgi:DNA-binding transcriptional LysR family regulator
LRVSGSPISERDEVDVPTQRLNAMKRSVTERVPDIDFDLRQLEIFKKVVELESFSKAADAVHLAQASVSERIATLESQVGARLLDRLGRQVVPTKAGEVLYKHAVLLLEMKENACLEMQELLGVRKGMVRIGGSTIPGEYILPGVISRFHALHPLVTVDLSIGDTGQIERQVLSGEIELGVVGSKLTNRSLWFRELWKDQLVLAIPSTHRWSKRREISPHELFEEPFIMREEGSGTLRAIEYFLQRSHPKGADSLNVVAYLGSSTAVKQGILSGFGVSILSSRALTTELKMGVLKGLKVKGLAMSRAFHLVKDKRRIASPLCQALSQFLLSTADEPPEGP